MSDTPIEPVPATKRCRACGQVQDIESFNATTRTTDGRINICKLCVKDTNRPRLKRGRQYDQWSLAYTNAREQYRRSLERQRANRDFEFVQLAIGTCLTRQHRQCYRCPTHYADGAEWFFLLDEDDKIEGLVCPDCR